MWGIVWTDIASVGFVVVAFVRRMDRVRAGPAIAVPVVRQKTTATSLKPHFYDQSIIYCYNVCNPRHLIQCGEFRCKYVYSITQVPPG